MYGSPQVRTPRMQSLAEQGMVFNRAFIASPACAPVRAALMSGLIPARNGSEPNHSLPREETQTMVKALQDVGYEVVAFGKIKQHTNMVGFDKAQDGRREQLEVQVRNFLKNRKIDKLLCLMVGDHRPHVAWLKEANYNPA